MMDRRYERDFGRVRILDSPCWLCERPLFVETAVFRIVDPVTGAPPARPLEEDDVQVACQSCREKHRGHYILLNEARWLENFNKPSWAIEPWFAGSGFADRLAGWASVWVWNAIDRFDEIEAARRAARRIPPSVRAHVMERDKFRCRRCGAGPDQERLEVDHIVPVARGGTSARSNLQTLCSVCNAGKGDRPPHPHDISPLVSAAEMIALGLIPEDTVP